jgi:histidine ammonia-lyase
MANTFKSKKVMANAALPSLDSPKSQTLEHKQARSAILSKIVAIMQGRSGVRAEVAEYLAALLNENVIPSLSCDEALSGLTSKTLIGEGVKEVSVTAPGIASEMEAATLNELLSSPGLLAYAIATLKSLLPVADASASLTCEALMAFDEPFKDSHSEKARAHNGQVNSAANLRSLLSVSKNLRAAKVDTAADPDCVRCIPQVRGIIMCYFSWMHIICI